MVGTVYRQPIAPIGGLQDELDEQLLPLFIEEALDLNQNIAAQLHAWRNNPADSEPVAAWRACSIRSRAAPAWPGR
jgi:hypothetical protein